MDKKLTDIEKRVLKLTEDFATKILNKECRKGKCFTTCYPLSLHLENNGFKADIIMGKYKGYDHYWLSLCNGETIIDPTIQQFDKSKPEVFVGKDKNNDYDGKELNDLTDVLFRWEICFINHKYDFEKELIPADFDKKVALKIILSAATSLFLEKEILSLRINYIPSDNINTYFDHICKILRTDKNGDLINDIKPFLPEGFERLSLWSKIQS